MKHGEGVLIDKIGNKFEGNFIWDSLTGFAIFTTNKGVVYKCEWKDYKQEGKGEEIWPDSSWY